ncbi:MAG: hypothetical protein O3A29_22580 [Planctomycetota bacterium]|nr:hypothetical protein [Planctomycetota bacterium]
MTISVTCTNCGTTFNVDETYAGTRRRCSNCKAEFDIPPLAEPTSVVATAEWLIAHCIRCSHKFMVASQASQGAKSCPKCGGPVIIPNTKVAAPPAGESITVQCVSCTHRYSVEEKSSQAVTCPKCGGPVVFPNRAPASLAVPLSPAPVAVPLPPAPVAQAVESRWLVLGRDRREHGPHTFAKLQLAVQKGFLRPDDLIQKDGESGWVLANTVGGLFTAVLEPIGDVRETVTQPQTASEKTKRSGTVLRKQDSTVSITCPGCGKKFTVDNNYAGTRRRCSICGVEINFPSLVAKSTTVAATVRSRITTIPVTCTGCSKTFTVDEKHAGKRRKCNKCGAVLEIPAIQVKSPSIVVAVPVATPPKDVPPTVQCISCSHRFTLWEKSTGGINCPKCGGPAILPNILESPRHVQPATNKPFDVDEGYEEFTPDGNAKPSIPATETEVSSIFINGQVYGDPEISQDVDATDAYREALFLRPGFLAAKTSLELTKRKLIPLARKAYTVFVGIIPQDKWFQFYLNPFEVFQFDKLQDIDQLDIKSIQRAKKKLLQEIDLNDGRMDWIGGFQLNKSRVLELENEILEVSKKRFHWAIFKNRRLLNFMTRGDIRHFLYSDSYFPHDTLQLLTKEPAFRVFLSKPFASQYNFVLTAAFKANLLPVIESLFDGRRWVTSQDDDTCFEGAFKRVNELVELMDGKVTEGFTRKISVSEFETFIQQHSFPEIFSLLPNHFTFIQAQRDIVQRIRNLAVVCFNKHDDAELSIAVLHQCKRFNSRSVELTRQLEEDFSTIQRMIAEQQSHSFSAHVKRNLAIAINYDEVRYGSTVVASDQIESVRWGIIARMVNGVNAGRVYVMVLSRISQPRSRNARNATMTEFRFHHRQKRSSTANSRRSRGVLCLVSEVKHGN